MTDKTAELLQALQHTCDDQSPPVTSNEEKLRHPMLELGKGRPRVIAGCGRIDNLACGLFLQNLPADLL